jgi:hypothetical protein
MAVPKKGWRPILVNQRRYFWRAIGTDSGIDVVVVTEAAFTRGATAQQLTFTLDYDHLHTPLGRGGVRLRQRAAVAPGVVSLAIESTPGFTGEIGRENVTTSAAIRRELQDRARRVPVDGS